MIDIISFYLNEGTDNESRTLAAIWEMSDEELADTHDVIQFLFPLPDPSQFNADAPILTDEQIILFRSNPKLQENLRTSFHRFMKVFGFECIDGQIRQVTDRQIWTHLNHNWLRFTRILKSLILLGLDTEARAFFEFLEMKIGNVESMRFWREAVGR